jgi:hypothetical protein
MQLEHYNVVNQKSFQISTEKNGITFIFTSSILAMHPHYVLENHSCTENRINSIKDTEGHAREQNHLPRKRFTFGDKCMMDMRSLVCLQYQRLLLLSNCRLAEVPSRCLWIFVSQQKGVSDLTNIH